jgi:L,D-transpeptidase YcbB
MSIVEIISNIVMLIERYFELFFSVKVTINAYVFMRIITILRFLTVFLLINGCSSNDDNQLSDRKLSFSEKLETFLNEENRKLYAINEQEAEFLKLFYEKHDNKSIWLKNDSLSVEGIKLKELLNVPESFGIPRKRLNATKLMDSIPFLEELSLNLKLAQLKCDLKYGFIDSSKNYFKERNFLIFSKDSVLNALKNNTLHTDIIQWGIQDTNYVKLANALYSFIKSYPLNTENVEIPAFKKDSVLCLSQSEKSLHLNGYLKDSISFIDALKTFQRHNGLKPDGVIGDFTVRVLQKSNYQRVLRACLAMEKWRWKEKFPKHHIYVNIPEFKLRYYHNDTLKSEHNIVVGTYANQTPEFCSKLYAIVAFPYWNVPYSISSKEILPALKKNPNYLTKNKMRIFRKKEEVDPTGIDWKKIKENSFPYSVRQDPGPHNSLGIIKFEFNNPYGVYVHDTPSKSLFKTTIRSYSHGCVRCESPVDLGRIILENDENKFTADSLDSILKRENHFPIRLKKYIPICFDYISVNANKEGEIIFMKDIYGRDAAYVSWMQ